MSDAPSTTPTKSMDAIMSLCKRRGFIYQASEIYGGINGFWDYGPLGAQMKKNLRDAWWQDMIMRPCWGQNGPNGKPVKCVPVETRIIQHPKVWEASGHVGGFNDPMTMCKQCKKLLRADHVPTMRADSQWQQELLARFPSNDRGIRVASAREIVHWQMTKGRKIWPALLTKAPDLSLLSDGPDLGYLPPAITEREDVLESVRILFAPFREYPANEDGVPPDVCPNCGGNLTAARPFSLMFATILGATGDWENDKAYLRPETAQGIFVQFKNVVDTTRVKIPFGIGNTGTSFRNEVTPRNFTFRSREFEQAELEFFCHPEESEAWYKFWRDYRMQWWQSIGLAGDNLILREHDKDELSHYSVGTSDVEYRFPFTSPGYGELEGIAHRGCFDLTQHQQHSGVKIEYNDTERGEMLPNGGRRGERYIPHCIEPAAGLDRGVLALICEAYTRDDSRPSPEFMKFHPRIAPIKAAVFPLVAKDGMPEVAERLHADLSARFWRLGPIEMDEKQSIGKRYARMDEAGCPYCFTVDGDTLKDQTVTCRDRDTGSQTRISIDKVGDFLAEKLGV